MKVRYSGILSVLTAAMLFSTVASAQQAAAAPTPVYTGNIGGGFALTGGNTHTSNINLTAAVVRAKARNVVKGTVAYLRGSQNDLLNLDRTAMNIRDEYTLSGRTFLFGQLDYQRDQFKQMIFFWAPTGGAGYKLINSDSTQFTVDGGAGGVIEKNPGVASSKSGSLTAGQRFSHKFSSAATFAESLSSIWKTKDFADSLSNFSVGVTTTVVGNIQLKVEFLDSYKNRLTNAGLKKNDTAFVSTFVLKF